MVVAMVPGLLGRVANRQHRAFDPLIFAYIFVPLYLRPCILHTKYCILICMLSWSAKRKLFYSSGAMIILLLLVIIPSFLLFYRKPTCFDGKRNQKEEGIDCGGPCVLLCRVSLVSPVVLWERSFRVASGIYNLGAYVENPNFDSGTRSASYTFSAYDKNNLLLAKRSGKTFIPPGRVVPIFESGISVGTKEITRLAFDLEEADWEKTGGIVPPDIQLISRRLEKADTAPILYADFENRSDTPIKNVETVVVLFGPDGNAYAASKTVIDYIGPAETATAVFTWREKLPFLPARVDVIPKLYPGIHY